MSAHKLVQSLREHEIAYLGSCIDHIDTLPIESVPESNGPISCSSSRHQKAVLMRWPSKCLDCCIVFRKSIDRSGRFAVPYHQLVIVASWSYLLVIKWPFKPTNLLLMTRQFLNVLWLIPHVPMKDVFVPRACTKLIGIIPTNSSNSTNMSNHCSNNAVFIDIP